MEATEQTVEIQKPSGIIPRAERTITYMIDNQQYIYRGVVSLSLIFNFIAMFGLIKLVTLFDASSFMYGTYGVGIFYPLLTVPLAMITAIIARKRLNERDPRGVTYFAIFLSLELINGGYLILLAGLYAILNKAFRKQWEFDGPEWFKKAAAAL
jgi:hypothetical protein